KNGWTLDASSRFASASSRRLTGERSRTPEGRRPICRFVAFWHSLPPLVTPNFWEDFAMRSVTPSFVTAAFVCCVVACGGKQGQQAPATPTPTTSMGEVNAPHGTGTAGAGAFKAEINPTNNGTVTGFATMSGSQGGNSTVIAMTLGGPRGTYIWHV